MTEPKEPQEENTNELVDRILSDHFGNKKKKDKAAKKDKASDDGSAHKEHKIRAGLAGIVKKAGSKFGDFVSNHRKGVAYVTIGILAAGIGGTYLGVEAIGNRRDYPQRNILYTVRQEVKTSSGDATDRERTTDKRITSSFYKGGLSGQETTAENLVAISEWFIGDKGEEYYLKDSSNKIIVNAVLKNERLQAGPSLKGRLNWQEQKAVLGEHDKDDTKDAFFIWRYEPTRGRKEVEIDALRLDGEKRLINRLTDVRQFPLGILFGQNFRAGTILEKYNLSENDPKVKQLFDKIMEYNKTSSTSSSKRIKLIAEIADLEKSIPKIPVYCAFEDGFFKTNFQESTVWLGQYPNIGERVLFRGVDSLEELKSKLTLNLWDKDVHKEGVVRIENSWDFFPGNIPLLNKWRYSSPTKIFSLFDKTNNGGYTFIDDVGTLAKIEIQDFWLHYDKDLLYKYYLDKNGDGKIDKKTELIGQVLYSVNRGNQQSLKDAVDKVEPKRDITQQYVFTIMGGYETDSVKRYDDFLLCTYLESMMPNELNRGFGKHTSIGWLNFLRSDLLLLNERQFYDVSRALNKVNSMVAGHDIYCVLKAAQRPFAEKYAKIIDLEHDISMQQTKHETPVPENQ